MADDTTHHGASDGAEHTVFILDGLLLCNDLVAALFARRPDYIGDGLCFDYPRAGVVAGCECRKSRLQGRMLISLGMAMKKPHMFKCPDRMRGFTHPGQTLVAAKGCRCNPTPA